MNRYPTQTSESGRSEDENGYILLATECQRLWERQGLNLTESQEKLLSELESMLGRQKAHPLALYLIGKSAVDEKYLSQQAANLLSLVILSRMRPASKGVEAIKLLVKIIDRGNAKGIIRLCPPPVPVLLPKQPSPFMQKRIDKVDVAPKLRALLAMTIRDKQFLQAEDLPQTDFAKIQVGQLFVSAIVHSGCINVSVLQSLAFRLASADQVIDYVGNRLYVELKLGWGGQKDAEFRRYFLDHLTCLLILNTPLDKAVRALPVVGKGSSRHIRQYIWGCIRAFLRRAGMEKRSIPRSISALLDAVKIDLELQLPPLIVNYAARSFVSHSLKPDVWHRIHGIRMDRSIVVAAQNYKPREKTLDVNETRLELGPRWVESLADALKGSDQKAISARLNSLVTSGAYGFSHEEAGDVCAGFARHLLRPGKGGVTVGTARKYTLDIARRIGGMLGTGNVAGFGPEEWGELCEEVAVSAETPRQRQDLNRIVRRLHHYLTTQRNIGNFDLDSVVLVPRGLVPVDANIITHEEFLRIQNRLDRAMGSSTDPEFVEAAWLIFTLAYRCGLRRMEVIKLDASDLKMVIAVDQEIDFLEELLVRPTQARRLKTKNSTRKIPISSLLEKGEIQRLKNWFKRREVELTLAENDKPSTFLFSIPRIGFPERKLETIVDMIHRAMRDETGDLSLRIHHLRHSFASLSYLKLALSRVADRDAFDKSFPPFGHELQNADAFRKKLYGNERLTRRDMMAISSLLGHSGPDVSVEHYIHVLDLCLADHLAHVDIAPDAETIAIAAGKSPESARRLKAKNGLNAWVTAAWRRHYPEKRAASHKAMDAILDSVGKDNARSTGTVGKDAADSLNVIRLMLEKYEQGWSEDDISRQHGADLVLVKRVIRNARELFSMTPSGDGENYRHKSMTRKPDVRNPDVKERIHSPPKLRKGRDIEILDRIAPIISQILRVEWQLTSEVLHYFENHSRANFPGLVFQNPDEPEMAIKFLKWLRLLGLKPREIRFVSFDVTKQRSRMAGKWKLALGLRSAHVFDRMAPLNGRKEWACPWIGIEPVFSHETKSKTSSSNSRQAKSNYSGSPAFRFAMIMAAIAVRAPATPELP